MSRTCPRLPGDDRTGSIEPDPGRLSDESNTASAREAEQQIFIRGGGRRICWFPQISFLAQACAPVVGDFFRRRKCFRSEFPTRQLHANLDPLLCPITLLVALLLFLGRILV